MPMAASHCLSVFHCIRLFFLSRVSVLPGDDSLGTCIHNTAVMNNTLAKLQPGDTLLVPNTTFWMMGGVSNGNHPLVDVTFQLDGTLKFIGQPLVWPRQPDGRVLECIYLQGVHNSTFTSSGIGTLDGNGAVWWGYISYLLNQVPCLRLCSSVSLCLFLSVCLSLSLCVFVIL